MILIIVLRLLRLKLNIQSYLVTLIDDTAMAARILPIWKLTTPGTEARYFFAVATTSSAALVSAGQLFAGDKVNEYSMRNSCHALS
jgi:hypothetical protein